MNTNDQNDQFSKDGPRQRSNINRREAPYEPINPKEKLTFFNNLPLNMRQVIAWCILFTSCLAIFIFIYLVQFVIINENPYYVCPEFKEYYTQKNVSFNNFIDQSNITLIQVAPNGDIKLYDGDKKFNYSHILATHLGNGQVIENDELKRIYFPTTEVQVVSLFKCVPEFRQISVRGSGFSTQGNSYLGDIIVSLQNFKNQSFQGPKKTVKGDDIFLQVPANMKTTELMDFIFNDTELVKLLIPTAWEPGVSVAGYTLGGGHNPLFHTVTGSLALYLDSMKVVLARNIKDEDDTFDNLKNLEEPLSININDISHPKLMRTMRGAGQNLGIALSLTFKFNKNTPIADQFTFIIYETEKDISPSDIRSIFTRWDEDSANKTGLSMLEFVKVGKSYYIRVWGYYHKNLTNKQVLDQFKTHLMGTLNLKIKESTFSNTNWAKMYFDFEQNVQTDKPIVKGKQTIYPFPPFNSYTFEEDTLNTSYLTTKVYDSWLADGFKSKQKVNENSNDEINTPISVFELPQKLQFINYKRSTDLNNTYVLPNIDNMIFYPKLDNDTQALYIVQATDTDLRTISASKNLFYARKGFQHPNHQRTISNSYPFYIFGESEGNVTYSMRQRYDTDEKLANPYRII